MLTTADRAEARQELAQLRDAAKKQGRRFPGLSHLYKTRERTAPIFPALDPEPRPPDPAAMPQIAAISIYVDNIDRAVAFYRDILGFAVKGRPVPFIAELDHEGAALVLCQSERAARLDYSKSAGTVIGIASGDIVARAREFKARNVELVQETPQDLPGGRSIAVRDPAGNVIELLEFTG